MKYTITQLRADFPDDNACLEWLKDYLYPDGIFCPNDKKITPHHKLKNRRAYSCELCGHHTYPTANTIFHKSTTPLTLWFYAVYLMAQTRAGISAKQLERELGVTYKTAWRMFHQIRKMMADDGQPLGGEVEIDEMYMHPDTRMRSTLRKPDKRNKGDNPIVFGMSQRGGKVKAKHVKSAGVRVLTPEIQSNVKAGSVVYSDEFQSYNLLYRKGYDHKQIMHMKKIYVDGDIHTQNIENFWSNMKRGVRGVYRHVDAKYLQAYVDEYAFRQSHRNSPSMFWALLGKVNKV
jgi:transposase